MPTDEPVDATLRRAAMKDLSLVSLVPRWSGGETAPPIGEFFEIIEGSAAIGNWSEADRKQICALKLTDAARAFYSATPELRDPAITWQDFKARFQARFRDVRTVQYHFGQLYMARQRKTETAQEFLDRCRLLARKTVPCVTDPFLQRAYNEQAEQVLLAAYTKGLIGTGGRQVRYASPKTAEEALQIAINVSQAEIQEARDNAFYVDAEAVEITPAGRLREPAVHHTTARKSVGGAANGRKAHRDGQQPSKQTAAASSAQQRNQIVCYECRGYGHIARDCANRRPVKGNSHVAQSASTTTVQRQVNAPTSGRKPQAGNRRLNERQALN